MKYRLRDLRIEDLPYMIEIIEDKEIAKNFLFTRFPYSEARMKNFIENSWVDRENIHFAIEDLESNEYLGTVSLKNVNFIDKNAEYAIFLRKKVWGSGVAYFATNAIIEYGFKTLNLNKIYLNVLSSNLRAIKFYEKYGFKYEATFKNHVYINGEYRDIVWYAIYNKQDWVN